MLNETIINNVKINLFTLGTWSDHAISQDDYLKNWKLARRSPGVVQKADIVLVHIRHDVA